MALDIITVIRLSVPVEDVLRQVCSVTGTFDKHKAGQAIPTDAVATIDDLVIEGLHFIRNTLAGKELLYLDIHAGPVLGDPVLVNLHGEAESYLRLLIRIDAQPFQPFTICPLLSLMKHPFIGIHIRDCPGALG